MTFFASTYQWVTPTLHFAAVSQGARDGVGQIVVKDDRFFLNAPGCFSAISGHPSERTLQTVINSRPAVVRGCVTAVDGDLGLRIDELRLGSDDVDARYSVVNAAFEHLRSACTYRFEDGAARSPRQSFLLPAVDGASPMEAKILDGGDSISLTATQAVPLEEFEAQLAVFQALLTFAADMPCGRRTLLANDATGRDVQILGRTLYKPFEHRSRKPIEYSLRFTGEWLQEVINRWWLAYEEWQPVLQIIAGLRYRPGYVDADIIVSSAAIESVASTLQKYDDPRLTRDDAAPILQALASLIGMNAAQKAAIAQLKGDLGRTTFRSKVEQLIHQIDQDVWSATRLSAAVWVRVLVKARNTIAHANSDALWEDSALLRSVRDANWIVLTLVLMHHLEIPDAAIERAAERLGTRYGTRHRDTALFT